jgi:ELWxxDGT repeat protein
MQTNFIGVLLPNSPNYTVSSGFSTQLYDAEGNQTITVQAGASLSLLGSVGANTVRLSGNSSSWQVYRDGSTAVLVNANGGRVELAANTTVQTLQFDDRSLGLSVAVNGGSPVVLLGSQVLGATSAPIDASNGGGSGSTTKSPWTLLMSAGTTNNNTGGIFVSDGSAAGTELSPISGWSSSVGSSQLGIRFKTTGDLANAYFYNVNSSWSGTSSAGASIDKVGITNGTTQGTKVLMVSSDSAGGYLPGNFATVVGNQLVLTGGRSDGNSNGKILTSDGTVTGTILRQTDLILHTDGYSGALWDTAHQAVWFAANTSPYGIELARFTYGSGTSPTTTLVKDIVPGQGGGLGGMFYNSRFLNGAVLPDGKLIFTANDGVHGEEPWVSDGTPNGTFMLADVYPMSIGFTSNNYQTFGSKVAFTAYVNSAGTGGGQFSPGNELIFTDGTASGTTILDVNPGANSSNPTIVGQANGLLYFTAGTGSSNPLTQGLFSTDGSTFSRIGSISSNANWLASSATKAFFSVADAIYGMELWSVDLDGGGFSLVKDILPGSGSALASNISPLIVGGKLVFNAYTSATQQGLFVSDGTNAGTIQLSDTLSTVSKVIGNYLVFANSNGVFSVAADSATPSAVQIVSAASTGVSGGIFGTFPLAALVQTDADQVYFKTSNNDLYVTNGTLTGTLKLSGSVENYKVVAENAVFIVQNTNGAERSLWYSDGTDSGTHYVEALPANLSYDMANAVAIHTVGIPAAG